MVKLIINDPLKDIKVDNKGMTIKFFDGEVYGTSITIRIEFNDCWTGNKEVYKRAIMEAFDNG